MEKEMASYILRFFPRLLNNEESKAVRHQQSISKLSNFTDKEKLDHATQMYYQKGWLSSDPEVLNLLNKGYEIFESNVAERIIKEHPDKVFINNCTKCGNAILDDAALTFSYIYIL